MAKNFITANVKVDFIEQKAIMGAMKDVGWNLRLEMARQIASRARTAPPIGSPKKTGHNRNSIGWIKSGGKVIGRGKPKRGDSFEADNDANLVNKNQVAVVTTSGYGGFLNFGTRRTSPSYYMNRALAFVIKKYPKSAEQIKVLRKALAQAMREHGLKRVRR